MTNKAAAGHPGGSLSAADIVTALYFHVMQVDPENPKWADRDRFILSKGHACPVWYAALAEKGYFSLSHLDTLRKHHSILQGHPDMKKTPGIDMTSGSLGQGLSAGVGMALAAKAKKQDYRVYVMLGDGEIQEGPVWEAAMSAPALGTDNLTAIVDYNHFQSCGAVEDILPLPQFRQRWESFGWNVVEINGHCMEDVVCGLEIAARFRGAPTCVIAHTVKGKGVSYMENNNAWHQGKPTDEQYATAVKELEVERVCL